MMTPKTAHVGAKAAASESATADAAYMSVATASVAPIARVVTREARTAVVRRVIAAVRIAGPAVVVVVVAAVAAVAHTTVEAGAVIIVIAVAVRGYARTQ